MNELIFFIVETTDEEWGDKRELCFRRKIFGHGYFECPQDAAASLEQYESLYPNLDFIIMPFSKEETP